MPARWLVLTARVTPSELLPLVGEGLLEQGGGAVVEEGDDTLVTYLPDDGDPPALVSSIRAALRAVLPAGADFHLGWTRAEDRDWAAEWKRGLAPRRVTDRIVVRPSWTEWAAEPGQVVIDIDPQMAFGTGEHATTRGCLRLLDRHLRPGDRVVDVGSGSGILAIAAALLGASAVTAVEHDADANLNARENLERNGVSESVRLLEAFADRDLLLGLSPVDLVLANILSGVIRPLLPAFHDALATGGRIIVSGILATEAEAVTASAGRAGLRVAEEDREQEWWSALLVPGEARG